MLKFSLGIPKKIARRLDGMPSVETLQELLKQAVKELGKDVGVAWVFNEVEFKLFVRAENNASVLWRVWNSSMPETAPPWSTQEKNPRVLEKQLQTFCNDMTGVKVHKAVPVMQPTQSGETVVANPGELTFLEGITDALGEFECEWSRSLAHAELPESRSNFESNTLMLAQKMTNSLVDATLQLMKRYADQFNRDVQEKRLEILITNVGEVIEWMPKPQGGHVQERIHRWRASNSLLCISVRARLGQIEFFMIDTGDALSLGTVEHENTPLFKLLLITRNGVLVWMCEGLPVSAEEVRRLMRFAITELIRTTVNDEKWKSPGSGATSLDAAELEKRNLAQKIVSQQEEVQRRIARDLHDAVIADVTLLKRSILADTPIGRDDAAKSLDQIAARLREICYELSPSDLKDWGLQTTIEALLDNVSSRTGAQCTLVCEDDIPSLDSSVELHIFRIIQEALNNSAKYSGAKNISVTVEAKGGRLAFYVQDDGRGFDTAELSGRTKEGGMGRTSMQERIELIRTLYPARLEVQSQPGKGTLTILQIKVRN